MCKGFPSSAPQIRKNRRQTARQLDAKISKNKKLPTGAAGERMRQSISSFDSLFVALRRSSTQNLSLRFGSERPVDAHFRFGTKYAPTPNDKEPRAENYIEASSSRAQQSLKVSSRLIKRFVRYAASNIASKRLKVKNANNRRQLLRGSRKFSRSFNIDKRIQQKRLQLATTNGDSPSTPPASSTLYWRILLLRPVPG